MRRLTQVLGVFVVAGLVAGCGGGPTVEELAAVQYAPEQTDGWTVSTPQVTSRNTLNGSTTRRRTTSRSGQLLEHRAGYAWEESSPEHDYSNLSSHLLSLIVSRACDTDFLDSAEQQLFGPFGIEPGEWTQDWEGYRWGAGELHLGARDIARFGQLYLDGGQVWRTGP